MKLVQHPNVVHLYEVIDTQTKLYLVMELGDGGDLYEYIMKRPSGLSEAEACFYFAQVRQNSCCCLFIYCHLHVM
jgi:serine/threonine protein kinase